MPRNSRRDTPIRRPAGTLLQSGVIREEGIDQTSFGGVAHQLFVLSRGWC
jgi:hypothetical protein